MCIYSKCCRPHNFVDSSISYCVLPHIFVQRNNHAADDINSCEFTVSAAGHTIFCCMDFRIFWNFIMLWGTQKLNAVRQYKFMLSWHSILCCSWQKWKRWPHFLVWTAAFLTVSFYIFLCRETNLLQDDINLCEFTANAAGHIYLCCLSLRFFTVHLIIKGTIKIALNLTEKCRLNSFGTII